MSLSARIALEPSRAVAAVERIMAAGGVVVAAATAAWRWPSATGSCAMAAVATFAALAAVERLRRRRAARATIVVADRLEVGLADASWPDDGSSWTLAEPTMVWPGFAVVALAPASGAAKRLLPVGTNALPPADRRALRRFLVWSLRAGHAAPSSADGVAR